MSISYFTGFEVGGLADAESTAGTVSVQNTIVKNGAFAGRIQATASATSYIQYRSLSNGTGFTNISAVFRSFAFWFRYETGPATNAVFASLQPAASADCNLRLNSNGTISVYNLNTHIATSSAVLNQGTWYKIFCTYQASTPDEFRVYVDEVLEISANFDFTGTHFRIGRSHSPASESNNLDFYYDDVVVATGSDLPSIQIPTGLTVIDYAPTSDGSSQGWTVGTGTTFAEVDDYSDDDTTYWATQTITALHLVKITPTIAVGSTIHSVIAMARNKRGGGNIDVSILNNGTRVDETTALDITYGDRQFLRNTDTDGGAWAVGDLTSMEIGVRCRTFTSGQLRCTSMRAKVLYEGTLESEEEDSSAAGQFLVFFN